MLDHCSKDTRGLHTGMLKRHKSSAPSPKIDIFKQEHVICMQAG